MNLIDRWEITRHQREQKIDKMMEIMNEIIEERMKLAELKIRGLKSDR